MLFKNILVPYDGSSFSKHAFKVALDIATKYDSKINMVSCVDTFGTGWYTKYYSEKGVVKLLEQKMQKEFSNFESAAKKKGVILKPKIIETSSIVKTLVSFTKSNKIDLIIIGSHGRGFFDRLILGSVVNGIVQKARCPVLVVK